MKHRALGLTLLETMIAVAIVALLASLAVPSFGSAAERSRLRFAAETLASDLGEARFEAARRGQPLQLEVRPGAGWCWAIATQPGCGCDAHRACQLKTERAADHGGIRLVDAAPTQLEADGQAQATPRPALFESTRGERLQVSLSPLGRARICAPAAAVPGYPAC
ncbi:GspH/FimT family pseudopilin [Rubrivivax gelatinosus]|uniref:Type II secretion system protein H n=1 Tax=Rubrivivax gelatinosus (strain NBRC 100245 / IL144) TaxID=983917 RepID=I0HPU0_RUBGI|nr:GspH/FimT family pseudopilin [Rubrivivax gelatinosus]MBG6081619.1 type IV fimbrial biogenesis protein FimT [Rubrivivax gelatinosus]BAL95027.1 type IV pilus transmembrane FimT-like protein [Rubrivivax gelatinosus IL144]